MNENKKKIQQLKNKKEKELKKKQEQQHKDRIKEQQEINEELAKTCKALKSIAGTLDVKVSLPELEKALEQLARFEDYKKFMFTIQEKIEQALDRETIINTPDEVSIKGFRDLWEMVVRQNNLNVKLNKEANKKTIEDLTTALVGFENFIEENLVPSQSPDKFVPQRRVVKVGNKYMFDDNMTSSGGRGGGGSSSGGVAETGLAKEDTLASIKDTDGIKKITDALPAGTNKIGSIVPDRPSQGAGRTQVQTSVLSVEADTTLHTVTTGKTLYVTSAWLSGRNDSTNNAVASIQKNDGTKIALAVTMPANILTTQLQHADLALTFAEPFQYAAGDVVQLNVNSDGVWSAGLVGYEE